MSEERCPTCGISAEVDRDAYFAALKAAGKPVCPDPFHRTDHPPSEQEDEISREELTPAQVAKHRSADPTPTPEGERWRRGMLLWCPICNGPIRPDQGEVHEERTGHHVQEVMVVEEAALDTLIAEAAALRERAEAAEATVERLTTLLWRAEAAFKIVLGNKAADDPRVSDTQDAIRAALAQLQEKRR